MILFKSSKYKINSQNNEKLFLKEKFMPSHNQIKYIMTFTKQDKKNFNF